MLLIIYYIASKKKLFTRFIKMSSNYMFKKAFFRKLMLLQGLITLAE